jgi:hypothetical protein
VLYGGIEAGVTTAQVWINVMAALLLGATGLQLARLRQLYRNASGSAMHKITTNQELRQCFLKMVEKLIPQLFQRLETGSAIRVARLGHKRLSGDRIMELRIKGCIKDSAAPDVSHLLKGS